MLQLWLRSFTRVWRHEVDRVVAIITYPIEQPVMGVMMAALADVGAELVSVPGLSHPLSQGEAIAKSLDQCGGGQVMLIDEDCLVLRSGEVDRCFRLLERDRSDIVAAPLGDATPNIMARSAHVFGLAAPHFSPNLFFSHKRVLDTTDRQFDSKVWQKGDYIPPLDYTCEQDEHVGRLVWASMQMRAASPRISLFALCDGPESPDAELFRARLPWVHIGALAQGKQILMDGQGLIIALRDLGWPGSLDAMIPGTASYWEKKLAVWMLCRQWFPIRDPEAAYYNELFDLAAWRVLEEKRGFLSHARVMALLSAYSVLLAPLLTGEG